MDPNSAAEELPALYRALLDRVAQLEGAGRRDLANRIRAEAIQIYSGSWDDRARRALETLLRRHTGELATDRRPGRSFRRRIVRAA